MARVVSVDEESILALLESQHADDLAAFGSKSATETNTTNITAQGLLIAQNHADVLAVQASIVAHGNTLADHEARIAALESA